MRGTFWIWAVALALAGCSCFAPVRECVPATCSGLGANCGLVSDGCGALLDCGSCGQGKSCGGGGVPNVCGARPACIPTGCAALGAKCGKTGDGCGGVLDCGLCAAGEVCGGGGVPNVCGSGTCAPQTCATRGAECGPMSDGCGGILQCGSCASPKACAFDGGVGTCSCTPTTCAQLGARCGAPPDGCGRTLDCGGCDAGFACGGAANGFQCACAPATCQSTGASCGAPPDGCGGSLSCGSCTAPRGCGLGGQPYVCGCPGVLCDPAPVLSLAVAGTRLDLTWTDPSAAETAFELERSLDGGSYALLVATAANVRAHPDVSVQPNTTYWYRVRATADAGPGSWSNVVSGRVTTNPPATNAWSTIGSDNQHTGVNALETGRPPLSLAWSFAFDGGGTINPVVSDGPRVYAAVQSYFAGNAIYGLDAADGGTLWSRQFGSKFSLGQPAVFDGKVYVAHCNHSGDTKLWSLDALTGAVHFSVAMSAQWETYWAPVVDNGAVFTNGGYYGGLYGFRTSDGANLFFLGLEQYDEWSPAIDQGKVYTFVAGKLRQHDPVTGAINWTTTVTYNWSGWSSQTYPVIGAGRAYVIARPVLYAVDLTSRAVSWSATGLNFTGVPAFHAGRVYAVSAGNVRVHDAATGAYLWTFVGDGALSFPPVIANGYLYASSNANVYAVDLATRAQVWTAAGGGWLSISGGKLYVASGRTLTAYSLSP